MNEQSVCNWCDHPAEGHGIRYVAVWGEHVWTPADPGPLLGSTRNISGTLEFTPVDEHGRTTGETVTVPGTIEFA